MLPVTTNDAKPRAHFKRSGSRECFAKLYKKVACVFSSRTYINRCGVDKGMVLRASDSIDS